VTTAWTTLCLALLLPSLAVAGEHREVLHAALKKVESIEGPFDTIVLSPDLSPELRQAAWQLRTTVEQSTLAPSVDEQLPDTYFRLGRVDIQGDVATVSGDVGAVLRPDPSNLFGCGVGYVIGLKRSSQGTWVPQDVSSLAC